MTSPQAASDGALASIRRSLIEAPVRIADSFAQVIRKSPTDKLDRLMQTPARRPILSAIFWQMPRHLDRGRAAGMNSSVRWQITGRRTGGTDTYHLVFKDGRCRIARGARAPDPSVTITVDGAEFLRIVTGNSDPMQAYFKGRLKLSGDIMLAAKVGTLFRIPGARARVG